MTISEIRKMEEARHGAQKTVHLTREGEWYRAHDWSAWLLTNFPVGEAKDSPLKVTAKKLKDGYVDVFVGFPCTSMGKFLPNDGTIEFLPVSDTQIDVILRTVDLGDATDEQLRQQVDDWKNQQPLQENKKQRREEQEMREQAPRITRLSDVMARIIAIPMEDISPKEAYDILRELRRQVAALF